VGLLLGWNHDAVAANFHEMWSARGFHPVAAGIDATTAMGVVVAICVSQSGSLFAADSWHDITFAADEVKDPRRTLPLALAIGSVLVIVLYLLANVAYLATLPLPSIQTAPDDRVATAMIQRIFPWLGRNLMAVAIMVSTFGCINSLVLAGARAYYAMARDRLFFRWAGRLNRARVPGWSILLQGIWSVVLVLPRTYNSRTGAYGNLYSNLLDYIISAALVFYILTIAGLFRLRVRQPDAERPYKALGYPAVPALYILGATAVLLALFVYRSATTWPGLLIVVAGMPVYWLLSRRIRARGQGGRARGFMAG
jgi:APA family basic amino acid/polyamine antiporter